MLLKIELVDFLRLGLLFRKISLNSQNISTNSDHFIQNKISVKKLFFAIDKKEVRLHAKKKLFYDVQAHANNIREQ